MSGFGALVTGGALAGAAYLYLEIEKDKAAAQLPPPPSPEPDKPGYGKAGLFAPLLDLGVTEIMNFANSKNTSTGKGLGGFLDSLFGGGKDRPGTPGKSSGTVIPAAYSPPVTASPKGGIEGRLLSLIGGIEAPQGYDQVYGGSKIRPHKPLTSMTISELLAWQDRSVAAGSKSSAAGRYQFIRKTVRGLVSSGVVRMSDRFSPATQDKMALALMKRRGLDRYKAGNISIYEFSQELSREWASLPAFTKDKRGRAANGQSYYAGDGLNKALTTKETVLNTILGAV